jgi:malate dehydrogenase (oxaloacetate-decarboxylating)(NADP+)
LETVMPENDTAAAQLAFFEESALELHASGRPGKLETRISKSLATARDLSLAYSPGVAVPCLRIHADPELAYTYTTRGNMVAVISNGTAVLGLGNIGALASKPVMEGKVALFKRFADVDGIDLEVSTEDVEEFINCVRLLGASFGGINLEDIKAPECFIIESRLRELMDIPVFHDDQHGTAIVAAAALINACYLTKRELSETRLVVNGAGAAGIACIDLLLTLGMRRDNIIACDTKGVIHRDRRDLNQWKSAHAVETSLRTLAEAMRGADVFLGLSAKGALTQEMVRSMAPQPIILALANPDPEITPEEARAASPDAIVATGRSDYPNQVNNVLGFPYIFRGALDVRASTINEAMKAAAAEALAVLAREDVPDEVHRAAARQLRFGPEYIIPNAFDPRLITRIPLAVARAAVESGVARRPMPELRRYQRELAARLDTAVNILDLITEGVRDQPKRMVFAEGENETMVRAAAQYHREGFGTPILIGNEVRVREAFARLQLELPDGIEIRNARLAAMEDHNNNVRYTEFLYARLQRRGMCSAWSTRTATSSPPARSHSAMRMAWSPVSRARRARRWKRSGSRSTPSPGLCPSGSRWWWRGTRPCWWRIPSSTRSRPPSNSPPSRLRPPTACARSARFRAWHSVRTQPSASRRPRVRSGSPLPCGCWKAAASGSSSRAS